MQEYSPLHTVSGRPSIGASLFLPLLTQKFSTHSKNTCFLLNKYVESIQIRIRTSEIIAVFCVLGLFWPKNAKIQVAKNQKNYLPDPEIFNVF